jgi:hypothetical protein
MDDLKKDNYASIIQDLFLRTIIIFPEKNPLEIWRRHSVCRFLGI